MKNAGFWKVWKVTHWNAQEKIDTHWEDSFVYILDCQQTASTDLSNPLVPEAHNSVCQNLPVPLQIKSVKVS